MYGHRLEQWEKYTEWPLVGAAVLFFVAYATQVLVPHDAEYLTPAEVVHTVHLVSLAEFTIWATWVIFLIDYLVRLAIARPRWRWFYRHLLDLAVVALPALRQLRLLTVFVIIQRKSGNVLRGRVMIYTVGATIMVIFIAALAIFDAERHAGNITSFVDALWWAFVTVTTVGYGDFFPVTAIGRLVAIFLMVCGIALIGVVTATLASWIVEKVSDESQVNAKAPATEAQVEKLRREVAELKTLLSPKKEP